MIKQLSQLEQKVLLLIRSLKPYEWIEIRNKDGKIQVILHSTVREDFPIALESM